MKPLTIVFLICLCSISFTVQAEPSRHTVSGTVSFPREGVIRIMLVDEKNYTANTGRLTPYQLSISVDPKGSGGKSAAFSFTDVAPGWYCINCFLDLNGNGILDKGLFGPTEPWNIYKRPQIMLGRPQFKDAAFYVDKDIAGIEISLQ